MKTDSRPLMISLKPVYADLVFSGRKTAELRRRISTEIVDRDVFIYVSSPLKVLRGGFRVGQVWEGSPSQIWDYVSSQAAVPKEKFFDYYGGNQVAYALEIKDVWEYETPIPLSKLRELFASFVVPQSYRYLVEEEILSLKQYGYRFAESLNVYA